MPEYPLEIFYDGNCRVCSTEIDSYRRNNPQERLEFIDIRAEEFQAETYGRTSEAFLAQLHVRDGKGHFATGVDAFLLIWQAYPNRSRYRWLAAALGLPGVKSLARCGYALFARYRHLLPKRKVDCVDGTCNLHPPH